MLAGSAVIVKDRISKIDFFCCHNRLFLNRHVNIGIVVWYVNRIIPVEGVDSSRLRDSFLNSRGRHRKHLAIDIGAPKGTPVVAAADGEIVILRRENRGGISLYQKDKSGKFLLYYCHLSRYAKGLKPGDRVEKGQVIAQVGRTGHASGPHLHFSITRLAEEDDNFKAGVAINPYLLFLATVQ